MPVTVFVSGSGGALTATRTLNPSGGVNLTSEGTSDWAEWGYLSASNFNYRALGGRQISDITRIGTNIVNRLTDFQTQFSWNDGTPVGSASGSRNAVFVGGLTNGFEISAPADTNTRTLRVYVGLYGAQGNFQAWLSDFSGLAYADTTVTNQFGNSYAVYSITYTAATNHQRLIVRYTAQNLYDTDFGNVAIAAATLQGPLPAVQPQMQVAASDANGLTFSFTTQPGFDYSVQYTTSLAPINWQVLTNVPGSGGTITVTDSVNAAGQRFYRVLAQ